MGKKFSPGIDIQPTKWSWHRVVDPSLAPILRTTNSNQGEAEPQAAASQMKPYDLLDMEDLPVPWGPFSCPGA